MQWSEPGFDFRITFSKVNYKERERTKPITPDYARLSIEEKEILLYLLDNLKITRKTAVALLKVGETKAKEIFKSLLSKDLIHRYGKGRSTYYVLKEKKSER